MLDRFKNEFHEIARLLEQVRCLDLSEEDGEISKKARTSLWRMEKTCRGFPMLFAIAPVRYFDKNPKEWDENHTGDEAPICFLVYAKENVGSEYVDKLVNH